MNKDVKETFEHFVIKKLIVANFNSLCSRCHRYFYWKFREFKFSNQIQNFQFFEEKLHNCKSCYLRDVGFYTGMSIVQYFLYYGMGLSNLQIDLLVIKLIEAFETEYNES